MINKKLFYLWMMIILFNIFIVLFVLLKRIDHGYILICISLFISIIPALISGFNNKLSKFLGYSIPFSLFLLTIYFIYKAETCDGLFCSMGYGVYWMSSILSTVIFILLYQVGVFSRKLNSKLILSLMWVGLIIIIGFSITFLVLLYDL